MDDLTSPRFVCLARLPWGGAGARRLTSATVGLAALILAGACSSGTKGGAGGGPAAGGGGGGIGGAAAAGTGGSGSGGYAGPVSAPLTLFPAPGSEGVCRDPALRLTFAAPPTVGTAGRIQVWNEADTTAPVVSIDLAAATVAEMISGARFILPRPVAVDGNSAVVHLPAGALGSGQRYQVTVEGGAIFGPDGGSVVSLDPAAWRFATTAVAPADLATLTVAADGTGDFCTVQGAIDAVPAGNMNPVTINIRNGTYREVVAFASKNNITFHGQDRKLTVIAGVNNNNLNNSSKTRSLFGVDTSTGIVIENMTIQNLTPQGGSQAEALRLGTCDKCIVRDMDILSFQDTLQWSGRVYATNCYIEGNVDFIWGVGVAYFKNCEIKTVGRAGYNVQARNPTNTHGYVFVDSKLTSDPPSLIGHMLGRIDARMFPGSAVAYIDCEMGSHILPTGWMITGAATPTLRFWEYRSRDPAGNPIDVSTRAAGSKQLTEAEAAMMRDPAMVMFGWQPPL